MTPYLWSLIVTFVLSAGVGSLISVLWFRQKMFLPMRRGAGMPSRAFICSSIFFISLIGCAIGLVMPPFFHWLAGR